jgi:replicative DNA helicase
MVNNQKLTASVNEQMTFGKILPQDTYTEAYIISKILASNAIGTVAIILKIEDFYKEEHQIIYSACLNVFIEGQNVDLLSCRNELIKLEKLDEVGGILFLQKLIQEHYTYSDVEAMAYLIRDLSIKRKLIYLCHEKIKLAFENSSYGYQLLGEFQNEVDGIQESLFSKEAKDFKSGIKEVTDRIGKDPIIGYPTGINNFDEATNGVLAPDLIVIAAQPGEGKSVLAINWAESMAMQGHAGMFFSLEMKQTQIIERYVSRITGYSVKELRRSEYWCDKEKCIKKIDPVLVKELSRKIETLPIHFHDSGLDSYMDIGAIIKAEVIRKKLKWIIIDYLQLVPVPSGKGQSRDVEIGKITRFLKILAMKMNLPIIILSQVNRQRNRKKYCLQDLRESGNIEQDADGVIFIFRPKMHGHEIYECNGDEIQVDQTTAILQIEKWRAGEPGTQIQVKFYGKTSEFKEMPKTQYENIIKIEKDDNLPF